MTEKKALERERGWMTEKKTLERKRLDDRKENIREKEAG